MRRFAPRLARLLFVAWLVAMIVSAYVYAPGLHDNDFPLLVWLGRHASWHDVSTITIGHYSPVALVMLGVFAKLGNALSWAKAVNLVSVTAAAVLVGRLARRLGPVTAPAYQGYLATAFFLLSTEPILIGQSEFGDPPVVALFLLGLDRLFARRMLAAGLALGAASLFRIYAPSFVLATLVLVVALRVVPWRDGLRLALGIGLAAFVQPLLYWVGQHRLSSPIADYVVGQVLYRYDEFNYLETWNQYPLHDVLTLYREDLYALIRTRLTAFPPHLLPALAVAAVGTLVARRRRATLFFALLCVYYAAYACLSWGITTRLMLLPVGLLAVMLGAAAQKPWQRALTVVATAAVLFHTVTTVPEELASVRTERATSAELTGILRRAGLVSAREAFVFDWDRSLTDDPTFEPYYNFGFWNILSARFRAERPTPWEATGDPLAFSRFLRDHGVRFVVFKRNHWRFPALHPMQQGEGELPGFTRIATLPYATVYQRNDGG